MRDSVSVWIFRVVGATLLASLWIVMYGVIDVVYHHHLEQHSEDSTGWKPREIPQCNTELWERITGGGND